MFSVCWVDHLTFTERFKNTRKTISLDMVLATLLKYLPILAVNVLKTSLKYFFITISSNVWQTFSYCLLKCYQLIGKVFWKSIIMQTFYKCSWDIVKRFDNVSKTLSNKSYYTHNPTIEKCYENIMCLLGRYFGVRRSTGTVFIHYFSPWKYGNTSQLFCHPTLRTFTLLMTLLQACIMYNLLLALRDAHELQPGAPTISIFPTLIRYW